MKHAVRHRSHQSAYDLNADLEKIKNAIYETTQDVKGRTSELIAESIDGLKEKTQYLQEGLSNYSAEKPFTTIGFAALGRFVLGYLLRYRRKY